MKGQVISNGAKHTCIMSKVTFVIISDIINWKILHSGVCFLEPSPMNWKMISEKPKPLKASLEELKEACFQSIYCINWGFLLSKCFDIFWLPFHRFRVFDRFSCWLKFSNYCSFMWWRLSLAKPNSYLHWNFGT